MWAYAWRERWWFERAAEQGHAEAQFSLGRLLNEGQELSRNVRQARAWLQAAARQGLPAAKEYLAHRAP